MARASAELYHHTMTRLNILAEKETRLKVVEEEKVQLEKELANAIKNNSNNSRLKNDLDVYLISSKKEEERLNGLLKTKDAYLADALVDVQNL